MDSKRFTFLKKSLATRKRSRDLLPYHVKLRLHRRTWVDHWILRFQSADSAPSSSVVHSWLTALIRSSVAICNKRNLQISLLKRRELSSFLALLCFAYHIQKCSLVFCIEGKYWQHSWSTKRHTLVSSVGLIDCWPNFYLLRISYMGHTIS